MQEKKTSLSGVLLLLIGAFVWGTTFVAQDTAADQMGPFTYLFGRSVVAIIFLGILITKTSHTPNGVCTLKIQ